MIELLLFCEEEQAKSKQKKNIPKRNISNSVRMIITFKNYKIQGTSERT